MLPFSIWFSMFLQNSSSCCNLDKVSLPIGKLHKWSSEISSCIDFSEVASTLCTSRAGNGLNV